MRVVSTWSPPSSVYFSELLTDDVLVVAKSNRIDVLRLTPDGVAHQCGLDVWGTVTSLNTLRDTKRILVTTDHPRPRCHLLEYQETKGQLPHITVIHSLSLSTRSARLAEFFQAAIVHHGHGIAVSAAYSANAKVINLQPNDRGKYTEFDSRVPELNILSMCFLPSSATPNPVVAILHIDYKQNVRLLARDVDTNEKEISIEASSLLSVPTPLQPGASVLIPVEGENGSPGGILALGGGICQLVECTSPRAAAAGKQSARKSSVTEHKRKRTRGSFDSSELRVNLPFRDVAAYTFVDEHRILVADPYGRLALLIISHREAQDSAELESPPLQCVTLGEVSSPSTLTYLTDGVFYVGSHFGDSQLARLLREPRVQIDGRSSHVEILETYKNIAPIQDAVVTNTDGSSQVVTCSGAYNAGSLKIIRKGADFEEKAVVENLPHIAALWTLSSSLDHAHDQFILMSTLVETRIIETSKDGKMEELGESSLPGLIRDQPTIAAGNLRAGRAIVQVTKRAVVIVDLVSGVVVSQWPKSTQPNDPIITVASVNPTQIVLARRGGEVVFLAVNDRLELIFKSSKIAFESDEPQEVSALSINPMFASNPDSSNVVSIGFWGTNRVEILKLPSLEPVAELGAAKHETHLPREVLLHTFGNDGAPYLLVGLADGTLVVYDLVKTTLRVKGRRLINMGTLPLRLTPCRYGAGNPVVFVSGSRPAMLFLENGRLQHSPIILKDVGPAAMLHSAAYPNSILIASSQGLVIGEVRQLHKLHIRSIDFGLDNPKRICHYPEFNTFGVCTVRTSPDSLAPEGLTSSFRVLDATSFETLAEFPFEPMEEAVSVGCYTLTCGDTSAKYFVVGTELLGKSQGCLRVYSSFSSESLALSASIIVPGCVFSIDSIDGKIVACINASVVIYELVEGDSQVLRTLTARAKWDRGYQLINVRVYNDLVVTADALRSIDILRWEGGKLNLVTRDHSSLWPVSMEVLDTANVLVAEGQGNVFTYHSEDGRLERAGSYHIGEQITEIRAGSLVPTDKKQITPEAVFFTANGRIGVVSSLEDEFALLLTALQRNLGQTLKGPGNLDHATWRAPANTNGPLTDGESVGFIDGDFVERFLDLEPGSELAEKVLQGANASQRLEGSHETLAKALEELQIVH